MRARLINIFLSIGLLFLLETKAQNCSPSVPSFVVDLSASPNSTWISPNIVRNGLCCGVNSPNVCVEFIIYLNPQSQGVLFDIYSGAVPGGSMFYQINCGPQIAVGQPVCLTGAGPHVLTFCKPGNNANQYIIQAIPNPSVSPDITLNEGCVGQITTTGLVPSSVTINSIYPGNYGAYNHYLSCPTGCASTQVVATAGYPPYVDYQVCGMVASNCTQITFCDTVRITFNSALNVQIQPNPAVICYGANSITLTATGSGGTPPYSFTWNTGQTGQSINVGVGNYTVIMQDATNCPPASASINVTTYPNPIQANAGNDQYICNTQTSVQLNGSVISATGGIWSGGQGTFIPSNTVLNPTYYPTSNEIQNGFVNLILTTTGNGNCPPASDTVRIHFVPFSGIIQADIQQVSCFGGSDGSISLNVSGGFSPYQFLWNTQPPSSSNFIQSLSVGNYTVTVTDVNGCSSVQNYSINQPSEIQATANITPPSCYGASNGTIQLSISGGTPGYLVNWSNGVSGTFVQNLAAGTYTCTVIDAKSCTKVFSFVVSQPESLSVNIAANNPICYNSSTGSIQVLVSGGTSPYTYWWSPSNYVGNQLNNLPAGIYLVTVVDSKGCTSTANVQLLNPSPLQLTFTSTNPTCYGLNNGSATVQVSGGTAPFFYIWSPYGGNQATASNLVAGNYSVSVYDANGCSSVGTVSLTQPSPLAVQVNWVNPVSCFGGNDGSVSIAVSGGTSPYSYQWLPSGGNAPIATGLSAGSYTVSVTDQNGCVYVQNISVSQPLMPLTINMVVQHVSCYGQTNGSISANVAGGTSPYIYAWNPPNLNVGTLINVAAGTYQLTVTDSKGCTSVGSAQVNTPQEIQIQSTSTPSVCGTNTGGINVQVVGGNPPYTYIWLPGNYTSPNLSNLSAGVYQLTVTDASNCTKVAAVNVNDIGAPGISLANIKHVSCFGGNDGSLTVTVSGGAEPYQYMWSPYGGNNATANGLSAGIFSVSVLDANGCVASFVAPEIQQPPAIQIFSSVTDVACFGASNGQASVQVLGGTPPYQYLWQPGNLTLPTIINLSQGTYELTVTDFNGCTETHFITVNQPLNLQVSLATIKHVSCYNGNDGSAHIQVIGGTPPYNYLWSPSNYTGSYIQNLSAGTHTVYITDSKGCATSYTITITQPPPISMQYTVSNAQCYQGNQGSISVFAAGGTPPYSYLWSPVNSNTSQVTGLGAGLYSVTVSDSLGCFVSQQITISSPTPIVPVIVQQNDVSCFGGSDGFVLLGANGGTAPYTYLWNNGQTTPYLSNLTGGTYSCTITDVFLCSATIQITINTPSEPLQLNVTHSTTNCFSSSDASASVTVSGGIPPYTYFWVPGGYTTSSVNNLSSGNYTVSVFDANQCVASQNISIGSPPTIQGVVQVYQHVQCYGEASGIIGANVVGGTPSYTYSWNTVPQQSTQQATNVYAGTYSVTVTDANGCSWIGSGIVNQPEELQLSIQTKDVSCFNGNNGLAYALVNGGTPPYSYYWSTNPQQYGFLAQNLTSGIYYVTVYDNNGCSKVDSCKIQQPTQIMAILPDSFIICKGESVNIQAAATGGAGGYLFFWSNSQLGSQITVSPPSSAQYVVYAFDSLGCAGVPDTCRVIVKEFYPSSVYLNANSPICPGQSTTIQVSAMANLFDTLYYQWSHSLGPGPGPFVVVPTQPTTYYVTVSNTCNVSVIDSVTVSFKPPPTIWFSASSFQGCVPLTIQFVDSSYTLYDDIYKWRWNFGDGTFSNLQNPVHTFQHPDTFYVSLEVETTQGCVNNNAHAPFPVYVYENPIARFQTNKDIYYLPNDPVIITNLSQGAVAYYWDFGDQTFSYQENPTHYYNDFSTYTITLIVTNMYQCTDTAVKVISVSGDLLFPNAFTPNTSGPNGGRYDMNDYSNQIFFPVSKGVAEFHMQIFNRWGELVFETHDINIGWDGYYRGELCQQDVYVYQAKAVFIDGRKVTKKGDVLLIR